MRNLEVAMTILLKKTVGLGLVLLGGLTAAHGGSVGQTWEISAGFLLAMVGAILLIMKIAICNRVPASRPSN
jgi:protein-S-isoprenylcysteine O-methyltransferase Ste14